MGDQIGRQCNTDPNTGEEIGPEVDPNLVTMVIGCVWKSQCITLVKMVAKGGDPNSLILDQLKWAVKLIPDGKAMRYETDSDWLVEQWRQLMEWKAIGYQGLDRDACMPQWADIMREVEERSQGMDITKLDPRTTASAYMEAARMYGEEGRIRLEEDLVTPVDGFRQPEAPWS
jgi:hypothetical protein